MEETENISLVDKKIEDLTVADYVKFNGIVLAASAVFAVALYGSRVAHVKFSHWRYHRKMKSLAAENSIEE